MSDKLCVIREDGTQECLNIDADMLSPNKNPITKILIGVAALFLGIFTVITIMSFLNGALGFDVVSALMLAGMLMLFPLSISIAFYVAYLAWKGIGTDDTTAMILVILVLAGLAVGMYFLWVWAIPTTKTLWGLMVASW